MQDILKSNTPAFVFDTAALKKRVAQIKEIVGETVSLCYSMKANPFFVPAMITCVDKLEVCSPGELTICKKLGVDASRIIYSGVNKEIPDIKEAYEYGVGTFTAESVRQADLIQQVVETAAAGEKAEVILRLNSGSQFGNVQRGFAYDSAVQRKQIHKFEFYRNTLFCRYTTKTGQKKDKRTSDAAGII